MWQRGWAVLGLGRAGSGLASAAIDLPVALARCLPAQDVGGPAGSTMPTPCHHRLPAACEREARCPVLPAASINRLACAKLVGASRVTGRALGERVLTYS
jgi:hypothetical protein